MASFSMISMLESAFSVHCVCVCVCVCACGCGCTCLRIFNHDFSVTVTTVMATTDAELPDRQSPGNAGHMTFQESAQLLRQICKQLSTQISPEMVATATDADTQEMVQTQLLPSTFEPHGLTTPLSVIIELLLHCFLLNRELQEVKGQRDEEVRGRDREMMDLQEQMRALKQLYEGVSGVRV